MSEFISIDKEVLAGLRVIKKKLDDTEKDFRQAEKDLESAKSRLATKNTDLIALRAEFRKQVEENDVPPELQEMFDVPLLQAIIKPTVPPTKDKEKIEAFFRKELAGGVEKKKADLTVKYSKEGLGDRIRWSNLTNLLTIDKKGMVSLKI